MILTALVVTCIVLFIVSLVLGNRCINYRIREAGLVERLGALVDLMEKRPGDKRNPEMRLVQSRFYARALVNWLGRPMTLPNPSVVPINSSKLRLAQ